MKKPKRHSDRSGRDALRSPGRPPAAQREDRRRFWAAIAAGQSSEDAASVAGVSPAGGDTLVPGGGRHATSGVCIIVEAAFGAVPAVRGAGGDRARCVPKGMACGRSPAAWGGPHRPSPGSCGGTRLPVAAVWTTGRRPHSGTPTARRAAQSRPSWRSTRRCGSTCRIVWPARSSPRTGRRFTGRP